MSKQSVLNIYWKDWCWSWNSNTLPIWCKELTHLRRPWCWERLKAGGEGDDRGWDAWMVSPTQWTCIWVNSRSWWWTGRPGMLQFMGSQRVRNDWATEVNWTELRTRKELFFSFLSQRYLEHKNDGVESSHMLTTNEVSLLILLHHHINPASRYKSLKRLKVDRLSIGAKSHGTKCWRWLSGKVRRKF